MESCGFWLDDALQPESEVGYVTSVNYILRTKILERVYVPFVNMSLFEMLLVGKNMREVPPFRHVRTRQKDVLFFDLMMECARSAPGSVLSYLLRSRLDRLTACERKEIVSRVKDGCAPLFIASLHGHTEIVDYLVTVCGADTEQRGLYEVPDDRSVHCVTALWVAAVGGRLSVLKRLVELGADVNAASDSGSTPVRSACFMTHVDVVKYLVDHGADIHKPNINGGTCLINSVESAELCRFLLSRGASVNDYDIQNKTALHYAIQEQRIVTTQVLLEWGANPYARNRLNDDALQIACVRGAGHILQYLCEVVEYPPERLADAHELMGATLLDEHNDVLPALHHWTIALKIRRHHAKDGIPLPKQPVMTPKAAFDYATEFTTLEELHNMSHDIDALCIQSLLICERILGEQHKDTLFRLMYRGASYADARRYQRCINLWRRVVEIRLTRDTVLAGDTSFAMRAIVKLFVDLNVKAVPSRRTDYEDVHFDNDPGDYQTPFQDVADIFELLAKEIIAAEKLLEIRPVSERQQEFYNRNYRCLVHLTYLIIYMSKTDQDRATARRLLTNLLRRNPREAITGNSILHLCVNRLEVNDPSPVDYNRIVFPDLGVVSELLRYGAPVNAQNCIKSTPLLVAAESDSFCSPLLQLLLDHGAHLDQRNGKGNTPLSIIRSKSRCSLPLMNHLSLRCLAASALLRHNIAYEGQIPRCLESFVQLH